MKSLALLITRVDELVKELTLEKVSVSGVHWGQSKHVLLVVCKVVARLVLRVDVTNLHVPAAWSLCIIILVELQGNVDELNRHGVRSPFKNHLLRGHDGIEIVQCAENVRDCASRTEKELLEVGRASLVVVSGQSHVGWETVFELSGSVV